MLAGLWWRMFVMIGLIILGGCGEPADRREVAFAPVAAYNGMAGITNTHYRGQAELVVLVSDAEEKNQLEALVPSSIKTTIRELPLGRRVLIAVFHGEKMGSGYDVEISRITHDQSAVYIYARFETPQRGQFQEGGQRSPVAVVSVERAALPAGQTLNVKLIDVRTGREVLAVDYTIK